MTKFLSACVFFLIFVMSACSSDDPAAVTPDPEPGTIVTTAKFSINSCDDIHYYGKLERAVVLGTENYFLVNVNVSTPGTYSFKTDETNGYYFIAEGEFTSTGPQELRFVGKGTPTAAQEDDVILKFGNATCGQKVTVFEQNASNPAATVIIVTGKPFMSDYYYTYAFNGLGEQLWSVLGFSSTPAVSGDFAYMISDNEVYARNILTGAISWNTSLGQTLQSNPITMEGDNLYVTGNGKLISIARTTGQVNWTYTFGTTNYAMWAPSVSNGKVFAAYTKDLHCLDLAGNLIWTYTMTNTIRSNPAVYNDVVYVGNDGGTLSAINISDKTLRWSSDIGITGEESPTIDNGKVYVQGSTKVFCLDADTGSTIWTYSIEFETTSSWSSPTVANGIVYVAGFGKGVLALDANTGAKLWNNNAAAETADNAPTVLNNLLIEGGPNGLAAINATTGTTIWNIAPFTTSSATPIKFETAAVIYDREKGEIAYPSTSGHKQ